MIMLDSAGLAKTFTLHLQGGIRLDVLQNNGLTVRAGECVALSGPSGAGKSTLLRALYGNYKVDAGEILVRHRQEMVDLTAAPDQTIIEVRRETLGYVSQFLRAVPRVAAVDIVAGIAGHRAAAVAILERLGIPPRLHALPPATFSGGEQQRVNLARAFIRDWPVLLLDEPTASLDAGNRDIVIALMQEKKAKGAAMVGIFHDPFVRDAIADRVLHLSPISAAA